MSIIRLLTVHFRTRIQRTKPPSLSPAASRLCPVALLPYPPLLPYAPRPGLFLRLRPARFHPLQLIRPRPRRLRNAKPLVLPSSRPRRRLPFFPSEPQSHRPVQPRRRPPSPYALESLLHRSGVLPPKRALLLTRRPPTAPTRTKTKTKAMSPPSPRPLIRSAGSASLPRGRLLSSILRQLPAPRLALSPLLLRSRRRPKTLLRGPRTFQVDVFCATWTTANTPLATWLIWVVTARPINTRPCEPYSAQAVP
ncbi:hypothetical protein B0H10DRAFT_1976835 [Mycena sp. CBHHK59/15]|nr:hypothetical protein B0H10DRAFT_1976835 [Mycena sp. CBHHK59/15]